MLRKFTVIVLLVSLAVLVGCGGEKSNSDEKLKVPLPTVQLSDYQDTPFAEVDAQAVGVMIDQSFKEVKKVLDDPISFRKEESEAVGYQLIAAYDFGELIFDALDDVEENSTLSIIIINKPNYEGPRGIKVGDAVDEVWSKFPRQENPVVDGLRELYNLQDGELMGQIVYDESKRVTSVAYAKGFGGFGTFSLEFAIKNNVVTEIKISVMNV